MYCLKNKKICVLGAGVVGLTTAYRLIELALIDGIQLNLTIIAENFRKETTSDGAGGLFRPDDRFMPGVDKAIAKMWSKNSFDYYNQLLFSSEGGKAGVFQASGYQLFNDDREVLHHSC